MVSNANILKPENKLFPLGIVVVIVGSRSYYIHASSSKPNQQVLSLSLSLPSWPGRYPDIEDENS
jgi:hypothetical protein